MGAVSFRNAAVNVSCAACGMAITRVDRFLPIVKTLLSGYVDNGGRQKSTILGNVAGFVIDAYAERGGSRWGAVRIGAPRIMPLVGREVVTGIGRRLNTPRSITRPG